MAFSYGAGDNPCSAAHLGLSQSSIGGFSTCTKSEDGKKADVNEGHVKRRVKSKQRCMKSMGDDGM